VPTRVNKNKKSLVSLNLNIYRNAHFQLLNKMKKGFAEIISPQVPSSIAFPFQKVRITYTLYVGTKHRKDLSNVLSVIDKFTCDALVDLGVMEDDICQILPEVNYRFGGYEKGRDECVVLVEEIND
jgi:hypothetical protein